MTQLLYRGIRYDSSQHESRSATPVDHVYRGHPYSAPLCHGAAAAKDGRKLFYRGHLYCPALPR